MPVPANLVHELSASTGTGNFTLTAQNGKQRFSTAFGTGVTLNVFDYFISNQDAAEWERGTGHMSAVGTLVRDTVIESTNANAAVNFSAGTKNVTNDVPALKQLTTEGGQTLTGYLDLSEIAEPVSPAADVARLYAADDIAITRLFYKNAAGGQVATDGGVSPTHFGAVGDGVADDTVAVQAAFDYAIDNSIPVYGLGKEYSIGNLIIKNKANGSSFSPVLRAYGQGAHLIKRSSADNNYLVAPYEWVNNTTFAQYPVLFDNWVMNGNGIAVSCFVDVYFGQYIQENEIFGATFRGVYFPFKGRDGVTNMSSSRGVGFYLNNTIRDNTQYGVYIEASSNPAAFISDMTFRDNAVFFNGQNLNLDQSAGFMLYGNRVFGHTNTGVTEGSFVNQGFTCLSGNTWGHGLNNASYCLSVSAANFPLRILGDNFQTENAPELGVNVAFGTGAVIVDIIDCHFEGTSCGINHAGNAATNEVRSTLCTFDTATPYTFSGGATHAGLMRVDRDRAGIASTVVDPAVISPSQITSDQNDYNPTGLQYANVLRLTSDASRNITGLQKGYFGRRLMLMNVGSNDIVLTDDDGASSTAANRFEFNANITLKPSEAIEVWYDTTSSRWRLTDRGPLARLNSAQTFTGQQTVNVTASFSTPITAKGTDNGNGGPTIQTFHESASPAANDFVGTLSFDGRDSAANAQRYGVLQVQILDPTSGSEDGILNFSAFVAGAETPIAQFGPRPYMTNATTTASAANAFLNSGSSPVNELLRSTSALRYKRDVEDLDTAYADAILNLRPIWYRSKCEADNPEWSWYGLGAEEVAKVDPRLVQWGYAAEDYDEILVQLPQKPDPRTGEIVDGGVRRERHLKDGAQLVPDGVAYERLTVMLLSIIKRQEDRLRALEGKRAISS